MTAYNSASDGDRLRMAEGLTLLAIPMVEAFKFTQAQFQRILSNFLGLEGAIGVPHPHHCGGSVTRVLTSATLNHLQVCPVLGRNSATHDAVRNVLSHLVVQNGVTNAAVVETRLTAADGGTFDADVVFFDPSSRARIILEVLIVTFGSDTSLGRGARAGMDGAMYICKRARRKSATTALAGGCLTRREITHFSPHRYVSMRSYGTLDGGQPQRSKFTVELRKLTSFSCRSSQH